MILLALDFETTGLDFDKDRVIEVGAILYSTGQKRTIEAGSYLVQSDVPISKEIFKITRITQQAVDKFGFSSREGLENLLEMAKFATAYFGQNVKRFDKRMFENWCKRESCEVPDKLWIDTRTDLPGVEGKHLGYMAADAGFLNLNSHSALSDCQTCLKLLEHYYPGDQIDKVIERAESPDVVLVSHQDRTENELVKKRKFKWNPDMKIWWKIVKEMDIQEESNLATFNFSIDNSVPIEKLMYQ